MTESPRDEFLAGERPDDVALYLSESFVDDVDALTDRGERTDEGVVLVVEGDRGRSVFRSMTGMDAMDFAGTAMQNPGTVDRDLTTGECPNAADGPQDHHVEFTFAFAEEQNEDVGGLYAEGNVVHAYVYCSCGTAYADKWVAGAD
jgi:hypothetical protein